MTRALLKIVFTVTFLWVSLASKASDEIGFISTTFLNSNVDLGDTIFFTTKLKNFENHSFNDSIAFNLAVDGLLVNDSSVFPNPLAGQIIHIAGGDSLPVSFFIVAKTPYFQTGPVGIVIWPKFHNSDSTDIHNIITTQVNVLAVGINEKTKNRSRFWVDNKTLFISIDEATVEVKSLKVFDYAGNKVYETEKLLPVKISMADWAPGIYLTEIEFANGEHEMLKIYAP